MFFKRKGKLFKEAEKERKKVDNKEQKIPAFFRKYAQSHPQLAIDLIRAGKKDSPEMFIKKVFVMAIYMSVGICFILFLFFSKMSFGAGFILTIISTAVPSLYVMRFNPKQILTNKTT